jgi:hypothetical protein
MYILSLSADMNCTKAILQLSSLYRGGINMDGRFYYLNPIYPSDNQKSIKILEKGLTFNNGEVVNSLAYHYEGTKYLRLLIKSYTMGYLPSLYNIIDYYEVNTDYNNMAYYTTILLRSMKDRHNVKFHMTICIYLKKLKWNTTLHPYWLSDMASINNTIRILLLIKNHRRESIYKNLYNIMTKDIVIKVIKEYAELLRYH